MRKTCEKWTVAYRKRNAEEILLDDTQDLFTPVPNTWRYWRADPFLMEMDGSTYLFAELFDRMRLKGVIGCCELTEKGAGKWTVVLDEPFHLSYPFLFRQGEDIYMIPESVQAGQILLYRATAFPFGWERAGEIVPVSAVDSTVADGEDGKYLMSLAVHQGTDELVMWKLEDRMVSGERRVLSGKNDFQVRPAGNIFSWKGKRIRPAQDCSEGYGYALNFYEIEKLSDVGYREKLIRKIQPRDVQIRGVTQPKGIHTYNASSYYEVIDYKEYEFGLVSKMTHLKQIIVGLLGR